MESPSSQLLAMDRRWGVIVGLLFLGFVAAAAGGTLPLLPEWLVQWTSWLLTAMTIVLGPGLVVSLARLAMKV